MKFRIYDPTWNPVNWTDDWSADPLANDADANRYYPVTDDWTAGDGTSVPVTSWHPDICETAPHTVDNILVEEWDGYTWRRAYGNGPVAGREVANVLITDVLDSCFNFGGFVGTPGSYNAGTRTVSWNFPSLLIDETGQVRFWVTVGGCGAPRNNTATISGTNENPVSATIQVGTGCSLWRHYTDLYPHSHSNSDPGQ